MCLSCHFIGEKLAMFRLKNIRGMQETIPRTFLQVPKRDNYLKKVGIKSRIQKSWGQTNNNCRCIFQIQHIVTQTRQNLCIHKTPCYDFLKRITSVLREKLCLTIARDFTLPFEDVINCILWDIRVSAPGWASYDSIIKDSDTVFSSPVFFWVI